MLNKISWVTCTYKRPQLLGRLIHCFLQQDYSREHRSMVILDDAGQYHNQSGDGWKIVSLPNRFLTLGQKRNALAALVPTDTEVYGVVDDDEMMLPHAMSACMAAIQSADLAIPSRVYQENVPGTFSICGEADHHSSWAYRRSLFEKINGYRPINVGEDVDFRIRAAASQCTRCDPLTKGYEPYCLYSRHAESYHVHDFKTGDWERLVNNKTSLGEIEITQGYEINRQGVVKIMPLNSKGNYASHVPVLKAIARNHEIHRVLEFGCGDASTALFLDQEAFPHLKHLASLESNCGWARNIIVESLGDKRLEMIVANEYSLLEIARSIGKTREKYDLAFVDGVDEYLRVASLLAVQDFCDILVAHDTEKTYWDDVRTLAGFTSYRYAKAIPNTTIYLREGMDTKWVEQLTA